MMKVPLLDLKAQYASIKNEIGQALTRVAESQYFILGTGSRGIGKKFDFLFGMQTCNRSFFRYGCAAHSSNGN